MVTVKRVPAVVLFFLCIGMSKTSLAYTTCSTGQINALAAPLALQITSASLECRSGNAPQKCPEGYAFWPSWDPPQINLINFDANSDLGNEVRNIVQDFSQELFDPERFAITHFEKRNQNGGIGSIMVWGLTEEVKTLADSNKWEAKNQADFDSFYRAEHGPIYARKTYREGYLNAGFLYVLPAYPNLDLPLQLRKSLLFVLGLSEAFFAEGVTVEKLDQGIALLQLIYAMPETSLTGITDPASARAALLDYCATR